MNAVKNFIKLTRAYTLFMTLASCLVIFSYAFYDENFSFFSFFVLVFALCCVHLGANLYDDYSDIKSKFAQGIKLENIKFDGFVSKAELILNKTYSIQTVRLIINILFVIATGLGLCFVVGSGLFVLLFMIAGAILTLFYPYSARYGLSELIVGLIWGPLMILGGYYAICGSLNLYLIFLSFAIFFTTIVLLHVNNIMDWEFDEKNGKQTIARRAKTKPNAIKYLIAFILIPYLIVISGIFSGNFNPCMLLVFLTLPIAIELVKSMKNYIEIKDVQFKPKWYYGFFENWKEIQEQKIDFLMYRMYLARNLSFFFALFATIGAMIG